MTNTEQLVICNTAQIVKMGRYAVEAQRNRAPSDQWFEDLDSAGVHLLVFDMLHNDVEIRALWLCKMKGTLVPGHIWIDCPPAMFRENTTTTPRTS